LKLRIDVKNLKPAEQSAQVRTPLSATESAGSQDGEHLEASAVSLSSGHTQPESEVPQAFTEEVLCRIASRYLERMSPNSKDDFDCFMAYMEKMRVIITGVRIGSLLITLKCDSLQILDRLWEDYSSGHLDKVVQRCFVTEEFLVELKLAELKLKTTMSEEEYEACRGYFEKDPARG